MRNNSFKTFSRSSKKCLKSRIHKSAQINLRTTADNGHIIEMNLKSNGNNSIIRTLHAFCVCISKLYRRELNTFYLLRIDEMQLSTLTSQKNNPCTNNKFFHLSADKSCKKKENSY